MAATEAPYCLAPVERPGLIDCVRKMDAALTDLTASSGTAQLHEDAVEQLYAVRRELAGELWGEHHCTLVPVDPDDLSEDAVRVCLQCDRTYDPADVDPEALAAGREAAQVEDKATKGEAMPLVRHRDGLVAFR